MDTEQGQTKEHRILLLGEGNFSYSRSLVAHLAQAADKFYVLATSFDSEEVLYRKYPEARRTIATLRRTGRSPLPNLSKTATSSRSCTAKTNSNSNSANNVQVEVGFSFDATGDYSQQLRRLSVATPPAFDSIVFNFPHLGVEDAKLYGSLVAHSVLALQAAFMPAKYSSAHAPVPAPASAESLPVFFLSLADAQFSRWSIPAMGLRTGMQLVVSSVTFDLQLRQWYLTVARSLFRTKQLQTSIIVTCYYKLPALHVLLHGVCPKLLNELTFYNSCFSSFLPLKGNNTCPQSYNNR